MKLNTRLVIAIIIFLFVLYFNNITGKLIENRINYYTHTKAVCNSTNFCQDYEITCRGNEILAKKSITGAVIQKNENWKDPRNNSENLCER